MSGIVVLFFILDFISPVKTAFEYSPVIEGKDGVILHTYLTKDHQWRMKTRLDEITPELKKAIIFKEDKYFFYHFGINPISVGRAFVNNVFRLKRTSGASTITMQVVRMSEPKSRTYLHKIIEMFRAVQLELHFSKAEIFQMYLNLVPYGSNIEGVKAASILYFNKSPDQLSLAEITALSIIPNRPNSLVVGKDNKDIIVARNKWLKRFQKARLFPDNIINDAMAEPLTAYRHEAPKLIPHFALRIRQSYPGKAEVRTSIDANVQTKAENVLTNYSNALKLRNIYNASVLIIDNRTHSVAAYIGSSDFKDLFHNGQVDGVSAVRSPGSTLKPLLYGLSIDHGIITPKTVIADVPSNFQGYTPENYDLSFRGSVSAEDALRMSLNIPAVKLLDRLSVKYFCSALVNTGFTSIWQDRKKMGLSMILGGCGVKLEELTNLYAAFANEGRYFPLQFLVPDSVWLKNSKEKFDSTSIVKSIQVLSPEANYMLTEILSELYRPDLPNLNDKARNIPKIAWKTGTSYGRKDAWSIGYNKEYTIGVWVGNFSGKGVPDLNGAGTAAPLLFELFNTIDRNANAEWNKAPKDLAFRFVCPKTGKIPNDFCEEQVMDYYIPGVSNNERCDHLKEVWLSPDEKIAYCTSCLPQSGYRTKLFPNISPELAAFYDLNHIDYDKLPPHNPDCSRTFGGQAPVITSLTNGMTYLVIDKEQQQLQLSCNAANDVHKVYWYINNKFFTSTKSGEKSFFIPDNSVIKISCTDDKGRNSNIEIKVRFI